MSTHQPIRPDWTCAGCGDLWPCPTRKRELIALFGDAPVSLIVHLTGFLVEACHDLAYHPAGVLHRRFLAWPADIPADRWRRQDVSAQEAQAETSVRTIMTLR